ncbi:MAG: hypothetical protein OXI26_00370 [bacterium]|nr:hypothetical protein [bacterium]
MPPEAASSQEDESEGRTEVRIVAQRRADGRTEFGLQQFGPDGEWGERLLPLRRFFPVWAEVGSWLWSSPLSITAAGNEGGSEAEVRIVARRRADGRIEFGLQQRGAGGEWGERSLPTRRFFPADVAVGRWLSSSPLRVTELPAVYDEFTLGEGPRSGETLVAVSHGRTCAVRRDGGVSCWGRNGTREHLSAAGLDDVVAVTIGDAWRNEVHACALHAGGTVSCWGPGWSGQLGGGDLIHRWVPTPVLGLADAVAVAAGTYHTCALHSDGEVSCWGWNNSGQLGDGAAERATTPQRVPGVRDVEAITAGANATCAIHRDGGLSCWGHGVASGNYETPRRISGLGRVVSVGVGWRPTCVARADGRVSCWQLSDRIRPETVGGITNAVDVAVGDDSICALLADGGVSCWGSNNRWGQLGDGSRRPRREPVRLAGITDAVAISMSVSSREGAGSHACAIHGDGSVSCWGSNEKGQLGDGTRRARLVPTAVEQPETVRRDRIPANPTDLMRAWLDEYVQEREDEFPWLRLAWDYIRERAWLTPTVAGRHGVVVAQCDFRDGPYACRALRMGVGSLEDVGILVHELAHVYDDTTSLTPRRAWGAVQLYFAVTYPDCFVSPGLGPGGEILADTMEHLVVPDAWLGYYARRAECPGLPAEPTREAEAVVRAGLAGEVPAWYTDNIRSGEDLTAAWRAAPSRPALANLAGEFGGLCTTEWLMDPLDPSPSPPDVANLFRDGGC